MPRYRAAYPPEFKRQLVDLFRSGRSIAELAEEFEPSAEAIRAWIKQADRDEGRRDDGPTSVEREELSRLRREVKQLRQERDILAKVEPAKAPPVRVRWRRAWFARHDVTSSRSSSSLLRAALAGA